MSMLEMENVHTFYGLSHILFDLSLKVAEGQVVCLLGRNGAGKTTTLKSVMGLAPPKSGKIHVRGEDVTGRQPYQMARKGIGYVPDDRRIFADLTVAENLEIAGSDTTLVFSDIEGTTWSFNSCRNITLRGFTIDYDPLPFIQGRITGRSEDGRRYDFTVCGGYPVLREEDSEH